MTDPTLADDSPIRVVGLRGATFVLDPSTASCLPEWMQQRGIDADATLSVEALAWLSDSLHEQRHDTGGLTFATEQLDEAFRQLRERARPRCAKFAWLVNVHKLALRPGSRYGADWIAYKITPSEPAGDHGQHGEHLVWAVKFDAALCEASPAWTGAGSSIGTTDTLPNGVSLQLARMRRVAHSVRKTALLCDLGSEQLAYL